MSNCMTFKFTSSIFASGGKFIVLGQRMDWYNIMYMHALLWMPFIQNVQGGALADQSTSTRMSCMHFIRQVHFILCEVLTPATYVQPQCMGDTQALSSDLKA